MDETKVVVSLPDCLIIRIFSRLPVKSLCRFKCVSKFYLSFIQGSYFIDQVRPKVPVMWNVQLGNDLFVFSIDDDGIATFKREIGFQYGFRRSRYCDGLNCCLHNLDLSVCNIATGESITLPSWCSDCIFCFDSSKKKYKVLGWVGKHDNSPIDFQVLTLERDPSWRPVVNTLKMESMQEPDIINGEPFWFDKYGDKAQIISFNPTNEDFRVIDLPDEFNMKTFSYRTIFEYEGSLSLVGQPQCGEPFYSLWILNDSVWVMMKKNITLPFQDSYFCSSSGIESWKCFNFSSRDGDIIVAVADDEFDCQNIFIYSFLSNQVKTLEVTGLPYCDSTAKYYVGDLYRMSYFAENHLSLQELVGTEVADQETGQLK